ncbi:unnamed protein product [Amoebophrya sp. A120]|nr:unnamed protein product [Amoebophrya sp. A120]|eukprot:GSA120T00024516001.1
MRVTPISASVLLLPALTEATKLSLFKRLKNEPEPWACYMSGAKKAYMGTVQVATSGQKCMQWSDAANDDKIATFKQDTRDEPAGTKLEGNFCRSFSKDELPWCYTLPDGKKVECNVPECPTDGPWAKDYNTDEVQSPIKCTDKDGAPTKDCDCSCNGVKGMKNSFVQTKNGREERICHCP